MNGFSLGINAEVYDAEALAMCGGLEAAISSPMARVASGIHICLDNLSVARDAGNTTKGSSQAAFKKFRDAAKGWLQSGKRMTVQWIPSHTGIEGNEIADQEAKKYAKVLPTPLTQAVQTLAHAKRVIRSGKDKAWQQEWEAGDFSGAGKSYQKLGLRPSTKIKAMPEMELRREVLGWLIAARSGHGHFADYHERFGHEEQDLHCECGRRRSQLHPFSCPNARAHRPKLWCKTLKRHFTPEEILGTPEGVRIFAEWAPATGLFRRNRSHGEQEEN